MLGFTRLILSLIIMAHHASGNSWRGGGSAVILFFVLSGFLHTAGMVERYGFSLKGQISFLQNRAKRIFPIYWMVLGVSCFALLFWDLNFYRERMLIPTTLWDWLRNILLINPIPRGAPQPVPTSWALSIEGFWWILIAFGITKTKRRALTLATASFALYLLDDEWNYFEYAYAGFPFAIGAVLYWHGLRIPKDKSNAAMLAGALSYPIFLSHNLFLAILQSLFFWWGWPLFFAALLPTIAFSWALLKIESRITRQ